MLTQKQQAAYTPQKVLDNLLAGNRRFVADDLTQRNHSQRIREAYEGQLWRGPRYGGQRPPYVSR